MLDGLIIAFVSIMVLIIIGLVIIIAHDALTQNNG